MDMLGWQRSVTLDLSRACSNDPGRGFGLFEYFELRSAPAKLPLTFHQHNDIVVLCRYQASNPMVYCLQVSM